MMERRTAIRIALVIAALLIFVPGIDLAISGWFYRGDGNFLWQRADWAEGVQRALHRAMIIAGVIFILAGAWATVTRGRILSFDGRRWIFLFLALAIGPGLVANTVFKDHWGRARPREITQFGGEAHFSPPLVLSDQCRRNCSFVAGDPTVGWYATSFAYLAPVRRRRRIFWSAMAAGGALGVLRIGMGGHFLSDVLFGAAIVLAVIAGLHALMFGWRETKEAWRQFTRGLIRHPVDAPPDKPPQNVQSSS